MESLVYERSPLADYLEGMRLALLLTPRWKNDITDLGTDGIGEGEGEQDWIPQDLDDRQSLPDSPVDFAPRGPPTFQERIRDKLPTPLRLDPTAQHTGTLAKIHDACSVSVSVPILGVLL